MQILKEFDLELDYAFAPSRRRLLNCYQLHDLLFSDSALEMTIAELVFDTVNNTCIRSNAREICETKSRVGTMVKCSLSCPNSAVRYTYGDLALGRQRHLRIISKTTNKWGLWNKITRGAEK